MQFQSLGQDDPLKNGMATHNSILAWRIPWTIPWGHKESDMTEQFSLSISFTPYHELNDCVSPKSIC